MNLLYDPCDLDDPALLLNNEEQIEAFRAACREADVGDGSLVWMGWETIIRARMRFSMEAR